VRSSVGNAVPVSFSYWNIDRHRYQYRKYPRAKICRDLGSGAAKTIGCGLGKVPSSKGLAQSASSFMTWLSLVLTGYRLIQAGSKGRSIFDKEVVSLKAGSNQRS
jgi:hypothetical protein